VDSKGQTDDRDSEVDLTESQVSAPLESPPTSEPDALTTAARLVVGTASLGIEALTSRLQEWGGQQPAARETTVATKPAPEGEESGSATDVAIALAARGARTAASLGALGAATAARGLRTAAGATDVLGRLVPDFLTEPLERARERASKEVRRLGAVGRDELDRSQAVAREALDDAMDAVFARVADSRELQFVIRTQSVTAAEQAVDGIRDQTARIDDRLEGAARKLLRRRSRPPATTAR
jgi:hypothetical protein